MTTGLPIEKKLGIVVGHHSITHHLKEALAAYSAEEVQGVLTAPILF